MFFGRHQDTGRLLELLQPTLQRGPGRFVAIVGPSGSGKSSLLRAGLLPRLGRLPFRWVLLPVLRPGQQPTRNLAGAFSLTAGALAPGHPDLAVQHAARKRQLPDWLHAWIGALASWWSWRSSWPSSGRTAADGPMCW